VGSALTTAFMIQPRHLKLMVGLVDLALTQERLVMFAVTGTASCGLVAEVANLQLGDMLWDHDAPYLDELKDGPTGQSTMHEEIKSGGTMPRR